jgi:cation diffusion facilitator CzcD-associated flavoprotein CzcO
MTATTPEQKPEHFDVIIIGAGLSGVGAAAHLQMHAPGKRFVILEARERMGGTWDLFRYPGIRSDSDMFTLGYRFRPWNSPKAIADGPSIRAYIEETARERGIDRLIRHGVKATELNWSDEAQRWTLTTETSNGARLFTCDFLWSCAGYYRYDQGYAPDFPGSGTFRGRIVHPQHWPQDLDYQGKRVVVIGSGATAVTLIPAMADKTAHITMLQRSPTWMISLAGTSGIAAFLGRFLPDGAVYKIMRFLRIALQNFSFKMARRNPKPFGDNLLKMLKKSLPAGYDIERHFRPRYNPWDQRLCVVPDEDLFVAMREGRASIETDEILRIDETGLRLKSGKHLPADIIVTATGLVLQALGGAKIFVNGRPYNLGENFTYKGMMFSGLPNLVATFGYTNASWTLRADLVAEWTCRLLNHMDAQGAAVVRPTPSHEMTPEPFLDFSSGYVTRATKDLPKQGEAPWRHPQDYYLDVKSMRKSPIDDGVLRFEARRTARATQKLAAE